MKKNNQKLDISDELKEHIYFVIPAFNEGKAIEKVLHKLNINGFKKLIIIDDGSTDNTADIVRNYDSKGLVLLEHVINRGQGASLKTGIDYALTIRDCKYIVTFDSDGQHRIEDLPRLIQPLERGECDIVLGSRFLRNDSSKLIPKTKKIVLKLATFVTWLLSNIKLTDTHNGYRVMNKKAAREINITMDGFEHASEILDEIAKKKIRFKERPVYIDYTDYSKQKGQKMSNAIKIFFKMLVKK